LARCRPRLTLAGGDDNDAAAQLDSDHDRLLAGGDDNDDAAQLDSDHDGQVPTDDNDAAQLDARRRPGAPARGG
jgi:hypothetical protein